MFTNAEKELLLDALEMAIKSTQRAQNNKNHQLAVIYQKIETDLIDLKQKIRNWKEK